MHLYYLSLSNVTTHATYLLSQNTQIGLFADLAQVPSLEGEGAKGRWGDIESSE